MTHAKLSVVVQASVLAVSLAFIPETGETRSVFGRIWDRSRTDPPAADISAKTLQAKLVAAPRWPQRKPGANGKVIVFVSPHQKGTLGDRLTALRLTGQGYEKLKSKHNSVHGIDGVYVRRSLNGEVAEIRLVESKVDSGMLNPGPPAQMSDAWIRRACQKMIANGDPQTADTAQLVLEHLESPRLKRELWHHDLSTGITSVSAVDVSGHPLRMSQQWNDRLVVNELNRQCAHARLVCSSPENTHP
jgi:hypothetical protein